MWYSGLSLQLSSVHRREILLVEPVKQSFLGSNNLVLHKNLYTTIDGLLQADM